MRKIRLPSVSSEISRIETLAELLKAARAARFIFGWVHMTKHDGDQLQLVKGSVLRSVKAQLKEAPDAEVNAFTKHGDLYIG